MKKKIVKKYADLILQANNASGRKEAVGLIHKAAKLKTKFENYEPPFIRGRATANYKGRSDHHL